MRILLIRHGDPDYAHDTLTAQGRKEAQLLARRLAAYVSETLAYYDSGQQGENRDTVPPRPLLHGLSGDRHHKAEDADGQTGDADDEVDAAEPRSHAASSFPALMRRSRKAFCRRSRRRSFCRVHRKLY